MWCGDIVLYGNKVGTVTSNGNQKMLALCDGSTVPFDERAVTLVASATDVVRQLKGEICKQAQL